MLVENRMSKPTITINADTMLLNTLTLLQKHEIHMLPVMEGDRLIGTFTHQDVIGASASNCVSSASSDRTDQELQQAISEIVTMSPITISHHQPIEDTPELLLVHKISGLPVINQTGDVVGVISKRST
jgi:acetoin utilization protein AcuB